MGRIVLEVSQLLKWPGRLTGIPRTMDELSRRFAAEGAEFIKWDPAVGDFLAVDLDTALVDRERIGTEAAAEIQAQRPLPIRALKALESHNRISRRVVGTMRSQVHKHRQREAATEVRDDIFTFQQDDVLFIAWGEAHDLGYIAGLKQAHEQGVILTQLVHDMIPLVTPQFAGHTTEAMQHYAATIFPICSRLYANSLHTKRDVEAWFREEDLVSPPVEVVHLGDDFNYAKAEKPHETAFAESALKGGDYIMCVGTIEARKNHALLYYVYKLAAQRGIELPKLVIVGRRGWKTDDIYEVMRADPATRHKIIFLHEATDENLSWLYDHCLFSVYVSFYEGWGLPIAESIMRGVPCVASNTSSMTEVADGLAASYISPYSTDECLEAITKLLDRQTLRAEKTKLKAYKPFSWDGTYQQIKATITQV